MECDFDKFTLEDINAYLKRYLSYDRKVEGLNRQGNMNTIVSETFRERLKVPLRLQEGLISENGSLEICYNSTDMVALDLSVYIKHR